MGKWLLLALALAVSLLLVALLVQLRSSPEPARAVPSPVTAPAPDSPVRAGVPRSSAPPPARPASRPAVREQVAYDAAPATAPRPDPVAMQRRLGTMPQRLMNAAVPCYRGEPGSDERVTFDYMLVIEGGEGRIEQVTVLGSSLGAPELEQCILGRVAAYRWRDPEAPDMREQMQAFITIADLRLRADRE